jgi:hypothetical protein
MGAWSTEPFGNDTAGDWALDLEDCEDLSFIRETIRKVIDVEDHYLDAPDAEAAIAAIDTLARLRGHADVKDAHTEPVDLWVEAHPINPPGKLIDLAVTALERILTEPSELLEVWGESKDFESWKNQVEGLKQRLQ